MIALEGETLRGIVAEARLAPSVHNVQPTRWRVDGASVELIGDRARSIPVADPAWRDWRLSHGAALEGFDIALRARGLQLADLSVAPEAAPRGAHGVETIARFGVAATAEAQRAEPITTRVSWRGTFKAADREVAHALDALAVAHTDLHLIRGTRDIAEAARLADVAGLHFLRLDAHRAELMHWMRLKRSHSGYARDGLNAAAMALSPVEAWGAGLVLGPLFRPLDAIGLAAPLTSEAAKTRTAAAVVLLHRRKGEDPFVSGRAFYRAWLAMERLGLKGCPMSVLADWPQARDELHARYKLGADRHIVCVFRIGVPSSAPKQAHARLPVDELIV